MWRKRKARARLSVLREANILRKTEEAKYSKAKVTVTSLLITMVARYRFRKRFIASQMHTLVVNLKSASKLLTANMLGGSSGTVIANNVFVIVFVLVQVILY